MWLLVQNPRLIEFTFSVLFNFFCYFAMGSSPLSSFVCLFCTLLLNLDLLLIVSQLQYVMIYKRIISVHRKYSSHNSSSLLLSFLPITQHVWGKKMLQASAVNESLQSLLCNNSHSSLFSLRTESYNSFSASANYSELVSTSISSYLSVSQKFVKKLQ